MKKYMMVKTKSLQNMLDCFVSGEEFTDFTDELSAAIEEIIFASQLANRNTENQDFSTMMVMKQLFVLGLFCKKNIELIHQLIRAIEYKEITKEEKEAQDGTYLEG